MGEILMTDNDVIEKLEEAVEERKAICSIYDCEFLLTRECVEDIIEAYKIQKAEIEKLERIEHCSDKTIEALNKKCSHRCNRRIPTFWWKLKVLFMRKGKVK